MWTDVIPGILVATAMFIVPGAAVLLCCRATLPTSLVGAPAVSLGIIAVSTVAASLTGLRWGATWVVGCTVGIALVCALWFWARPRSREEAPYSLLPPVGALQYLGGQVIATLFMVPLFFQAFISPDTIGQRYDNVFHLNAIAAIGRTGAATPMDTGELVRGSIYPNGWHTAAALVQELSGLELTGSVHALTLVTVLGVWPLSMWLLIETLVRPAPAVRILSGPLLLAFPGFPAVLLDWGLVYPTILGLAAAPALAAMLVHMLAHRSLLTGPVRTCLIIGLAGVGVGVAHPGSALVALIITLPIVVVTLVRHLRTTAFLPRRQLLSTGARHADPEQERRAFSRPDLVWALALIVITAVIVGLWAQLTPSTDTAPWSTFQTTPQAIGEVVTGGVMAWPMVPLISVITIVGMVASITGRTQDRRVLLALLGPAAVYVASSSATDENWRDLLSGFFYRDNFRTAAALTLSTIPVAIAGLHAVALWLRRHLGPRLESLTMWQRRPTVSRAVAAAVVGVLGATGIGWHVSTHPETQERFTNISAAYRTWESADIVSDTEFQMFEDLPNHVPENGYVIADPWEGGGLTYALGERDVSRLYMLLPRSEDELHLDSNFDQIAQDPEVCEALPDDRPLFYLDLDEHRIAGNDPEFFGYLGYQDITEQTPGFTLVHEVGDVQLYEVHAC